MKVTFSIFNPLNAFQLIATHKGHIPMPPLQGRNISSPFQAGETIEDTSLNLGGVNLFGQKVVNDMYFYYGNDEIALLNALCSINYLNDLVITPLAAGRGGVIELVSVENQAISISGYIGNDKEITSAYPYDQVKEFRRIFKKGVSFDVLSRLMNLHDITKVVVKNIDYPQQPNSYTNLQYFSMDLIQDSDIELIVKDNN